jgi:hypothetical protein
MRRPLVLLSLLLVAAVGWACGDKLMLVMGVRLSQVNPAHRAVILAYPGQNSASAAVIRDLQLQPAVKKAGHRFQFVEDAAGLDSALRSGKYDLVLADVANANELNHLVSSAPSRPVWLPVAYKPSKEAQSATQKKFHCLLKAPSDTDHYLAAIDQAMEWKLKAGIR